MGMNEDLEELARKPGMLELIQALQDISAKIERRPRLVAAIADPTTTQEAFYSMLFGEVSELVHQLKELEKTLPELNRDLMISAMAGITTQLDPVFGQVEESIKAQLNGAIEACQKIATHFARQTVSFESKMGALASLNVTQLTLDIQNAVELRNKALAAMQKAAGTLDAAATRLDEAAGRVESGRTVRLLAIIGAIVFAGFAGGFVGGYVASKSASPTIQTAPVQQQYPYRR